MRIPIKKNHSADIGKAILQPVYSLKKITATASYRLAGHLELQRLETVFRIAKSLPARGTSRRRPGGVQKCPQARAEGIVTRSNVDLTKLIIRLQVAQLAAGAMKLDKSNLSSVKPFTNTDDASVQALNASGIVEGYSSGGTSVYKLNNTLTRGQVSAIVWRMQNYQK